MKNLKLEDYEISEMSNLEMKNINGGSLFSTVAQVFAAVIGAVQDFGNGFVAGYRDGRLQRAVEGGQRIA